MSLAIELDGVSKRFGANEVLRDVSLTLPAGSTTAVVGESGSGKSTLLKLINGIHRADAGDVRVGAERVPHEANLPAFRQRIGYAVQGAGLFPHLNAKANVTLTASLAGWGEDRIQPRYDELLTAVGLATDVGERYPHELSGGQQQRLGLCRAFMLAPEVLLLDEPFSAVDPLTRLAIHDEFAALRDAEQTTTVLVTHDMAEALKLADAVAVIREGRIDQFGASADVHAAPANDYVRSLFRAAGIDR